MGRVAPRGGTGLTPWPPLQHLERGWRVWAGGYAWAWIAAYAAMTGGLGAIHRAPTEKSTLVSSRGERAGAVVLVRRASNRTGVISLSPLR